MSKKVECCAKKLSSWKLDVGAGELVDMLKIKLLAKDSGIMLEGLNISLKDYISCESQNTNRIGNISNEGTIY